MSPTVIVNVKARTRGKLAARAAGLAARVPLLPARWRVRLIGWGLRMLRVEMKVGDGDWQPVNVRRTSR